MKIKYDDVLKNCKYGKKKLKLDVWLKKWVGMGKMSELPDDHEDHEDHEGREVAGKVDKKVSKDCFGSPVLTMSCEAIACNCTRSFLTRMHLLPACDGRFMLPYH